MSQVVRDILVNVDSGDLLLSPGNVKKHSFFDIVWGKIFEGDNSSVLYANVIIPSQKLRNLKADGQNRFLVYAKSAYYPYQQPFRVRLVQYVNGEYAPINQVGFQFPVESLVYFPDQNLMRVNASELPFINVDGNYLFELKFGTDHNIAYIYTAENTDFLIGGSDLQSAQLLSICEPGKSYRYPTTGVGTTNYIGSVVAHTDLGETIIEQFKNNGVSVQDANFNANTGELQVEFFNEAIAEEDGLLDVDELNISDLDIEDSILKELVNCIDPSDYEMDYGSYVFNITLPNTSLESCFANGIWIDNYPWTGAELWKAHE